MTFNQNKFQNIANLRREYITNRLRRQDLPDNPIKLFSLWLKQAYEARISDPTAMVIATVDEHRIPHQRIVLLKHYDKNGLVFYTNLNSHKARHIKNNSYISLLFPWNMLERQITIVGQAKRLHIVEEKKYFRNRPIESQISTWASKQSSYIASRNILEQNFLKFKKFFLKKKAIPCPNFWGGFRISIWKIEFWQGRRHRLHDRFLYQTVNGGNKWKIYRLAP